MCVYVQIRHSDPPKLISTVNMAPACSAVPLDGSGMFFGCTGPATRVSLSRRQFVAAVPLTIGGASILSACSRGPDPEGYEAVAERIRRTGPLVGVKGAALSQELIRLCDSGALQSQHPVLEV